MIDISRRSIIGLWVAALIVVVAFSPQCQRVYQLPLHMNVMEGETALFSVEFPLTVTVKKNSGREFEWLASPVQAFSRQASVEQEKIGKAVVEFKLFGLVPIRTVELNVLPQIKLIPGGQSIGVMLHSQGIIVVGYSPVQSGAQSLLPAKEAGIHVGDLIVSVNGAPVQNENQLADLIDRSGKDDRVVDVTVKRGEEQLHFPITAVLCNETKRYRIGLFVRDSVAGVGTLSFYDPQSRTYGALGHVVTDNDTNQPIDCVQGKIVLATVSGIQPGQRGQPGEKIGVFMEGEEELGSIRKNTAFGIYGQLLTAPVNDLYTEPIPVASMSQIQPGAAEMLTVIDGQKIERFQIDIQKVNLQESPNGKGLVIQVTDPRLLAKTGGIVQGMSGSPIIQNGKLIGTVTHVFVHDPTRGYGCFIDWMLMESGILPLQGKQSARNLFTAGTGDSRFYERERPFIASVGVQFPAESLMSGCSWINPAFGTLLQSAG